MNKNESDMSNLSGSPLLLPGTQVSDGYDSVGTDDVLMRRRRAKLVRLINGIDAGFSKKSGRCHSFDSNVDSISISFPSLRWKRNGDVAEGSEEEDSLTGDRTEKKNYERGSDMCSVSTGSERLRG